MNDHYYTAQPTSQSRPSGTSFSYRGTVLNFITDAGVFSRGELDSGTKILLDALPENISGNVLDLGCGWGAVGVSLGRVYPTCCVTFTDINERALEWTKKNAEANGVSGIFVSGDGFENVPGTFDYIITNPPIRAGKQVIYRLFADSKEHLSTNGQLYIVIRKQQGAPSAIKYLETLFNRVETIDKSGGYWVIRCQ